MLRRRFVDPPWGQMHVLRGGHGGVVPLILLPGAATAMTPGASSPAAATETAAIFARFLDALPANVHPQFTPGVDP